jgi:hypothetical protein
LRKKGDWSLFRPRQVLDNPPSVVGGKGPVPLFPQTAGPDAATDGRAIRKLLLLRGAGQAFQVALQE